MGAPIISTALTAFGAVQQYRAGKDAEREAEMLSEQQRADERNRARAEQAERRARAAASGIQLTGSSAQFMEAAERQDKKRLDWMKRTGKARAKGLRKQGEAGAVGSLARIPGYWTEK